MQKPTRILIFSGGRIGKWALDEIRPNDLLVGADRGALFLVQQGLSPDLAIGDFDSVSHEEQEEIRQKSAQMITCDPVYKDYTDTEMAFQWALSQSPQEIILLGALGSRFDHSLANVHLLYKALHTGILCRIIDEQNEISLIDRSLTVKKGRFTHLSLLPLSMIVAGITLSGFQYPLHQATLRIGDSLGISNVLMGEEGKIQIESGCLLVIQSID